jgi:glucose/arabinose dehydrogenase
VVAQGLEVPWSLAFAPDGRLFFTERPGRVRVVWGGKLLADPWAQIEVARRGEGGLLGLALDPEFSRTGYVYIYYTYRDVVGRLRSRVVRLQDRDGRAWEEKVILEGIPGSGIHNGGRLRFGPDGKLYITTGDAADSSLAQDLSSLAGKILRLNPDGSVPEDNPFFGSPVYSYGHRNPQGLDWHPDTGTLVASEHGPRGQDEVNVIVPGGNYGWPAVTGEQRDPQFISPLRQTGQETWAPSGASFYTGSLFPQWRGDLFIATLRGMHLHRLRLDASTTRVVEEEVLFRGELGRLRDVVVGPDGALYLATSNRDGRGSPMAEDDRILRVAP